MSNLHIYPTPQALYAEAATLFVRLAGEAVAARGRFTVALSGGSTPKGVFTLLAGEEYRPRIPWAQVHLFWGDERCVPPTHPESNYRMAADALLSRVAIPAQNVHRIPAEQAPLEAARIYETEIRETFALAPGAWPRFDLVFLGMGGDGHTASLFPGTPGLHETTRLVTAHYVDTLQIWRVTLTPPVLNHAAQVVFLICGADKAATLRAVRHGAAQPERFPAQLIQPVDGTLLWLVDEAAARLLKREEHKQ
jgi:6-phosphogluconolactonase